MVLAIGARVSSFEGQQDINVSERWAAYFSKKADDATNLFENPSLLSTHFLILKVGPISLENGKVNDPTLRKSFLGHVCFSGHAT